MSIKNMSNIKQIDSNTSTLHLYLQIAQFTNYFRMVHEIAYN